MLTVLTGDIVASSDLPPEVLDDTLRAIGAASTVLATWPGTSRIGFARRGGDAWQIAFDTPRYALRAALYIQASLRQLDKDRTTRIAIATGDGVMPDGDPNTAHGPAFVASGRLLGALPKSIYMDHAAGGAEAAATRLADHIARSWTQAKARAMVYHLVPEPGTQEETGKALNVTRQAVTRALDRAGFDAIHAALAALEAR